jgi:uncharacterized protein (DUF58 family)
VSLTLQRHTTPRLLAYIVIGAAGLFAAAAFGRIEAVLLVAPLLMAALAGIAVGESPNLGIETSLSTDRLLEGETVRLHLRVASARPVPWLELGLGLPRGLAAVDGRVVRSLQLTRDAAAELDVDIRGRRWGNHGIGSIAVRARDSFGFFAYDTSIHPDLAMRVYPRPAALRRLIRPAKTLASFGNQTSRRSGDGIEFSNVRPYAAGDNVRRVNWRLSTRRQELHVNELHPETTTQVVLFLDTFHDVAPRGEDSTLAMGVRAVHGIADHYLRQRDRVGLVTFGAAIRWLTPAMGRRQSYRIVDALLDAAAWPSAVWKDVDLIPPRSLPGNALVLAVSPLFDQRTIAALFNLRARGFDLAVIEVQPAPRPAGTPDQVAALAGQLWEMEREMLRDRFRRVGVPVATWTFDTPLATAFEEIRTFRRLGRLAPA